MSVSVRGWGCVYFFYFCYRVLKGWSGVFIFDKEGVELDKKSSVIS